MYIANKWLQLYDYADWELELLIMDEPPIYREMVRKHRLVVN